MEEMRIIGDTQKSQGNPEMGRGGVQGQGQRPKEGQGTHKAMKQVDTGQDGTQETQQGHHQNKPQVKLPSLQQPSTPTPALFGPC